MNYNEANFLKAISESFQKYIEHGARSSEKLKPIHNFVAKTLQEIWGKNFQIHFMSDDNTEMTVKGKYYPKVIDITITHKKKPVFCLGIKFVTSNYKQNANNYFENMMGETANIQAKKNLPYAHLIILRHETPYYKKGNENQADKIPAKIEKINEHDLEKYVNLFFDTPQAHRPFAIGIILININEKNYKVKAVNPKEVLKKDFAELLENKLSVNCLFKEIENYKRFYLTKLNHGNTYKSI